MAKEKRLSEMTASFFGAERGLEYMDPDYALGEGEVGLNVSRLGQRPESDFRLFRLRANLRTNLPLDF
ncbi:hypothetical protein BH24ACI3_BH24ACI3_13270 [soil metagenome]